MLDKKSIREQIKEQRSKLSKEFAHMSSSIIAEKLLNMDMYKDAGTIYVYMNFGEEVITENIITDAIHKRQKSCYTQSCRR